MTADQNELKEKAPELVVSEEPASDSEPPQDQEASQAPQEQDQFVGTVIANRFEVRELIGTGGMGAVYKVWHRQLKKFFALKVILPEKNVTVTDLKRFDREAKAAAGLNHPNIAGVHDYGVTDGGIPYILMDYVEGKSLATLIEERGPIPQAVVLEIAIDVCAGLSYAHKKGILHRDVKPGNIIVTSDGASGRAVIVDFGIAKEMPTEDGVKPASNVTATGEVIGSPAYMSPEQCMGYKIDARSDIYSLACVMFTALTGKDVYSGENSIQVIFKHLNERPPIIKAVTKNPVKPELERAIMQGLEKEPQNRYQSAEDFQSDLKLIKAGKNPVKEVSKLRRGIKSTSTVAKYVIGSVGLCFILVLTYSLADRVVHPWRSQVTQAITQRSLGPSNYPAAEQLFQTALSEAERRGISDTEKQEILTDLGILYDAWDRPQDATKSFSKALELSKKGFPSVSRASLHDFLATNYMYSNQIDKAVEHVDEALKLKRQFLPPSHQYTINTLFHAGQIYRLAGKYSDAERIDREVLEVLMREHPKGDNYRIADAKQQLGNVLMDQGKTEEGLVQLKEALDLSLAIARDKQSLCEKRREMARSVPEETRKS